MSDEPFTKEELQAEANRFYMTCVHCNQHAIPQLMPLDSMVYVKLFIEQHKLCKENHGSNPSLRPVPR
jgi:hypothetical protein